MSTTLLNNPTRRFLVTIEVETVGNKDLTADLLEDLTEDLLEDLTADLLEDLTADWLADLTEDLLADLETTLVADALGYSTVVDSSFVSTTEVENFEDNPTRRFLLTIEVETVGNEDTIADTIADLETTLVADALRYFTVADSSFVSTTEVD